jgi:predicted dehydrogenase
VVAVADPEPSARAAAQNHFPDADIVAAVEAVGRPDGIDAAIVLTPDDTHADVAIPLLEAGIPVFLEKPMAITLTEADRILAAAATTGTGLFVGHNFRRTGVMKTLARIIGDGLIGEVKTIWVRHFVGNGGDYYFRDWHADRSRSNSLLLQKASHDIDAIHGLAGAYTRRVTAMGELSVYGAVAERLERPGQTMADWFSYDNWPPQASPVAPVVDVEDVSMVLMALDGGILASYQQCHFSPDYWRNYTVIGTHGRAENIGDTGGGVVRVWNRRRAWDPRGDLEFPIHADPEGHADADQETIDEFLEMVANQSWSSPGAAGAAAAWEALVAARQAVAVGDLATRSLRGGSVPMDVPPLPKVVADRLP